MTNRRRKLRPSGLMLVVLLSQLSSPMASAGKVEVGSGYFNMNVSDAKTGARTTIANLGLAYIAFRQPLLGKIELSGGMSLLMPEGIGGKVGVGFDLSAGYYPFTLLQPIEWNESNVSMHVWDVWRPFLVAGIQQRNLQAKSFSVSPTIFGFGGGLGAERTIQGAYSVRGEATYYQLTGPGQITAGQIDFKFGVSLRF